MRERSPLSSFLLPLSTGILLSLLFYRALPAAAAFAALVPLFLFLAKTQSGRRRILGGFLAGFLYFLSALHTLAFIDWFGFVSSEQRFMQIAYLLASAYAGLLYAAFAWGYRLIGPQSLLMLAYAPALFVLAEAGKRVLPFGFTWGFLGYLAEDIPFMLEGSSLAGVLGLTALIAFANAALALGFLAASERSYRRCAAIAGITALVFAAFFAASAGARLLITQGDSLRVAVMEVGNRRASADLASMPYTALVNEAKAAGARVILMPENLIESGSSELTGGDTERIISTLADGYDGTIIVGGVRYAEEGPYNSSFFWHDGAIEAAYDKHFLVPFAEYAPTLLTRFAPRGATLYERGEKRQLPHAGGIRYGVLTCQEVNYPEAGIRPVSLGAELLVSGANDGFAGISPLLARLFPSEAPWLERIQYGFARFRAAENGRYLIRSTKSGVAGIIGPEGEVVERTPSGTTSIRIADVALMRGTMPYSRTGDTPLLILSAITAIGIILSARRDNMRQVGIAVRSILR